MEEGVANKTGVVAARGEHALCWSVGRHVHDFTNEIHLPGSDHVADTRCVVEHALHMLVLNAFFFYLEHCHA